MLTGKKIKLQPFVADHAQVLADWFNDPDYLGEYCNIWPTSRPTWEHWIAEFARGPDQHAYFITAREGAELMGTIGYWNPFSSKNASLFKGLEFWWQVHPRFRRQGVASQAACLLVNHLFDATPIERLQATVVVGNEASCRVAERAGMQRDGIYRKVVFLHGQYVDLHLYAIVRDDWKSEGAYRQGRLEF